jgi:hypothetical protein
MNCIRKTTRPVLEHKFFLSFFSFNDGRVTYKKKYKLLDQFKLIFLLKHNYCIIFLIFKVDQISLIKSHVNQNRLIKFH